MLFLLLVQAYIKCLVTSLLFTICRLFYDNNLLELNTLIRKIFGLCILSLGYMDGRSNFDLHII